MNRLLINLFGLPRFTRAGESIQLARRKSVALLSYLAVTGKPHSRDALATMFWPEHDQSDSRANLRRELSRLKADLGGDHLTIQREQVHLNMDSGIDLDVRDFQDRMHIVRQHNHGSPTGASPVCDTCYAALIEAVTLYEGDFMSGFSLPDSPMFDEWQFFQSDGLRQNLAEALQHIIRWLSQHGDYDRASEYARRWLALDPMHEPAHRQLMRLYAWAGKQAAALRQYQEAAHILEVELGVEPEDETLALYEAIRTKRLEKPFVEKFTPAPPVLAVAKHPAHTIEGEKTAALSAQAKPSLKQDIHYTRSSDGVRIAYSTVGGGPVLVKTANWLSHLEFDWDSPVWRHWLRALEQSRSLVRYDERGCGLSDWDAEELSLDAFVRDLESVVDSLGLDQFTLLGISQGGPVSIAYAARHPEKVSRLILYGTYARGRMKRKYSQREVELGEVLLSMIKLGWGKDNPAFRQFFTTLFMPEASADQMEWFNDLQKVSTSPEMAARLEATFFNLDVSELVSQVSAPTLVLHAISDGIVPYQEGRWLAEHIPDARFVPLTSNNHILLENEPAWGDFLRAVNGFLITGDPQKNIQGSQNLSGLPEMEHWREAVGVELAEPAMRQPAGAGLETTAPTPPPHNLPRQLMPFVGREDELSEIGRMLSDAKGSRLVTLSGPGGMGKTRLAIEAALTMVDRFPDGVWFVPLQTLTSPDSIASAVSDAIQFNPSRSDNLQGQLLAYLKEKSLLLVLDNFEHLLPGAELVRWILDSCQEVNILVTSRQVLNLREEWVYPLSGLALPPDSEGKDLDRYASIQLFLERARRARHDFSLENEWPGVTEVCKLVEGLPLAIELAASWTRYLSANQIASEIRQDLNFLEVRYTDVPERHRSMQVVFDHSWRSLTREEQSVYKHLSVFRVGFSWHAAREVSSATLPVLNALADKSLLTIDAGGRYQIQELLRQYAEEHLALSAEEVCQAYDMHCDYYADYVAERLPGLLGGEQLVMLDELDAELENIRQAWRWAVERPCLQNLSKMLQAMNIYYQYQSKFAEGLQVFNKTTDRLERLALPKDEILLAEVLVCEAWLHIREGQFQDAKSGYERALEIYRLAGRIDRYPLGLATDPLCGLAILAGLQGDYEQAIQYGEQALRESAARQDIENQSFACYALVGAYLSQGEPQFALEKAESAYQLASNSGNRWFMAYCLNEWGRVSRAMGRYADARQRFLESFSIREAFNDPEGMAVALNHLGRVAILEEEYLEAKALFQNALNIYQGLKDRGGLTVSLSGLGAAALGSGDSSRARTYFRRALQISSEIKFDPQTLSILNDVAVLFLDSGYVDRGVELLALVKNNTASEHETRQIAANRLNRTQKAISADRLSAGIRRAEGLDLDTVARLVLQEL